MAENEGRFHIPTLSQMKDDRKISKESDTLIFRKGEPVNLKNTKRGDQGSSITLANKLSMKQYQPSGAPSVIAPALETGIPKSVQQSKESETQRPLVPLATAISTSTEEDPTSLQSSVVTKTYQRPHAIVINPVQRNNPVVHHIKNVPWECDEISADFVLGRTTCALFLSVQYHLLHPNYIHERLKQLGKSFDLRILLVLVDVVECQKTLNELAKIALLADLTLMLSWSPEEAARYLETYKAYEHKPAELLMERTDSDFTSQAIDCLTSVHKVNKTDAVTLLRTFKTMAAILTALPEEMSLCPGIGLQKAQRLYDTFHEPFQSKK